MIARTFFQRDPLTCACELIGCELVWDDCAGIIVETEAYFALGDEACHTFARPSARAFVEKHDAGTAYVYFNYGMYWLLNVLVKGGSADGFVLFRAIEPTRGIGAMTRRRFPNPPSSIRRGGGGHERGHAGGRANPQSLCSGPGKLTIALGVTGADHGRDLCSEERVGFRAPAQSVEVESGVRIGISKAAHLPWRFLLRSSEFLSAKPEAARRKKARPPTRGGLA